MNLSKSFIQEDWEETGAHSSCSWPPEPVAPVVDDPVIGAVALSFVLLRVFLEKEVELLRLGLGGAIGGDGRPLPRVVLVVVADREENCFLF